MIVDGHAHASGGYLNIETIIKTLDENNVDYVALCPGPMDMKNDQSLPNLSKKYPNADFFYFVNQVIRITVALTGSSKQIDAGNKYVYEFAKQFPERIKQFYWVNATEKNVMEKLEDEYALYKFKGLKIHMCWNRMKLLSTEMQAVAQWAGEKGLPIFIHLGTKRDARDVITLIKRYENTVFIVAHLSGLDVFMDKQVNDANVYYDISSYQLIPQKKLLAAIATFGATKIIMGSDTPFGNDCLEKSIERIRALGLSEQDMALIMGENMHGILSKCNNKGISSSC
ncbi:MAG: amidohydrolase family protein [Hyphomonadaceae bacterium]|nr:amidohydrolase family protein [Clostridia bacterium]